MSQSGRLPWYTNLYELLESDVNDEMIIEFIEDNVPGEGELMDYKSDMYISASSPHHQNRREAEFLEYCSALSNVTHRALYRYLFLGFNNDGEFEGLQYRNVRNGDQILDVDDARLRNVVSDDLEPLPTFELFELENGNARGGVLVIKKAELPPVVITTAKRRNDDVEFVAEGQAYTRDGSRTVLMDNSHYRELIENRERIIDEKLEEISDSMEEVVGISSEQLSGLDLTVSPQEEGGLPVEEFLTTDAPSDMDGRLIAAVKNWNGTDDLLSRRPTIYEFYENRDDILIDEDVKAEFLFRSCLRQYVSGVEWYLQYESDVEDLFTRIIAQDTHHNTIRNLEHLLLILNKPDHLQTIQDDGDISYDLLKAERYTGLCGNSLENRVCEYVGPNINFDDTSYAVSDLLESSDQADDLLDDIIDELVRRDDGQSRGALREVEMVRLGATLNW